MRSKFFKRFLGIFSVLYFIFSLRIAEAKGVATIFLFVAIVVAVVFVASYLIPYITMQALGAAPGVTTMFWTAPTFFIGEAVMSTIAAPILVGMAVGQVACLAGQDNVFFSGCSGGATTPTGWEGAAGSPVVTNESFTATCNSVSLTYDISSANQYGIYRDGNLVTSGNAQGLSKITYTDANLNKQTYYQYLLVMTDNQGQQFQYPAINAYTKCLPQCSFTTDKSEIIAPAQATLSWNCQDANSCAISPGVGSVNPQTGQTKVSPTVSTTYILTCGNIDGEASFSTNINVKKPKLEEVIP